MGFMLLGLQSGVVGGNWLNAADAYAAAMFYTVVYVLMAVAVAVAAVALSVIGAYYYLRIVKLMYFDEPKDAAAGVPRFGAQSSGIRVLMSANGIALLVLDLLPQSLMSLCYIAIKSL